MKREKWNKIVFFYSTSVRTVPKMERYYSRKSKFIGYRISHEKGFLMFGVPNAKYLTFGTPDENALTHHFTTSPTTKLLFY